jgi:glycosyltransferase involved in cell wall biosynthesis
MNILLITHIYPPAIDGGSRVISKIGEYFKNNGHQITILTTNCAGSDDFVNPKSKTIKEQQSLIYRLPVYKSLRRPLKFINLFIPKNTYFSDLLKILQKGPILKIIPILLTIKKLRQQKFDLIIAGPFPTAIILYANFLKKFLNTKLLINASFHQTDPDFQRIPLIKILQNSEYIWSLTQYEKKYFIKNLSINPKNIILAGNGIDSDLLISSQKIKFPKKTNLLFIGSFAKHKQLEILIDAFFKLKSKKLTSDISLTLAGQKTLYFPKILKHIQKLPLSIRSKINFCFSFPQSRLTKLIDQSTILILPSLQESFGLVLLETWARGKPVIATNISSLQELVKTTHGGLIFNSSSSKDLSKKITHLIKNPDLCQKLGKNGLEYVRNNYTWDQVYKKICQKL